MMRQPALLSRADSETSFFMYHRPPASHFRPSPANRVHGPSRALATDEPRVALSRCIHEIAGDGLMALPYQVSVWENAKSFHPTKTWFAAKPWANASLRYHIICTFEPGLQIA